MWRGKKNEKKDNSDQFTSVILEYKKQNKQSHKPNSFI